MSAMDSPVQVFARLAASEVCPSCGQSITWKASESGQVVEVLHPQPPCVAFRRFVDELVERHAKLKAESEQQRAVKLWGWCEATGKAKVDCYCETCKSEMHPVEPN